MYQYYVLSSSPLLKDVFEFIRKRELRCEVHMNRTRFWIDPHSEALTEFALRFKDHCPLVQDQTESP
jgi:hypothetical protein